MAKKRLDSILLERGLCETLEEAQANILAGAVWCKQVRLEKAGEKFPHDIEIELKSRQNKFVSRAGHKLDHAFALFQMDVANQVCMDIGASTGGFTHCLLQRGAKHVFAVDVGYGLLDVHLRQDPRVTNLERTNAKQLTQEILSNAHPLAADLAWIGMDVSFISLKKIVEPLSHGFPHCCRFLLLFKPQFEVEKKHVKKGGFVDDQTVVEQTMQEFDAWMQTLGLQLKFPAAASPLPGKKSGNVEYLLLYERKNRK